MFLFITFFFVHVLARGEKKNLSFIPAELFCRIFFALLYFPPAASSSSSTISPDNSYREKYDQKKKKMRGILYKKLNNNNNVVEAIYKKEYIYIYVNVCASVRIYMMVAMGEELMDLLLFLEVIVTRQSL